MTTENIIYSPIADEVKTGILDYAMSVITDRALPAIEDGLKPVQRALLYDMLCNNNLNNSKFVKCAQPVGDTMARFHPHGDSSIYGALALMSQPWVMRYPLITWHGNNGSRDGDPPASSRYTECKLAAIGELMLKDLKKNTVEWETSYTNEEKQPVYLTGTFPNLIVNGTTGIAWGMASTFLPHNLSEVLTACILLLFKPEASLNDIMDCIKGPDFPTGGTIMNAENLSKIYAEGKGSIKVRGEFSIESKKSGGDVIVFTSIPYKVSKEALLVDINNLCEDGTLKGISGIRDESTQKGVRFVIELEKGANSNRILSTLFAKTKLEQSYSFNQVALVNKIPKQLSLKELLLEYINNQKQVLIKSSEFDLKKIEARIHILNGILIALANLDAVLALIRRAQSATVAKEQLMTKYHLTEYQAKAILDMSLSRLARMETAEITNKKLALDKEKTQLENTIQNPEIVLEKIFKDIIKQFGDPRRTTFSSYKEYNELINANLPEVAEDCVVILTQDGIIKRVSPSIFKAQKRRGKGVQTKGVIIRTVKTHTQATLLIFTKQGYAHKIKVDDIPESASIAFGGDSIGRLITLDPEDTPFYCLSWSKTNPHKYLIFVTKKGVVKKTSIKEFFDTNRKKVKATQLNNNDELTAILAGDAEDIVLLTAKGSALRYSLEEIPSFGRIAKGVRGIDLNLGDEVVDADIIRNERNELAIFTENGFGKKIAITDLNRQHRGNKGYVVHRITDQTSFVSTGTIVSTAYDTVCLIGAQSLLCIPASEITKVSKTAQGNQMTEFPILAAIRI